MAAAEVPTVGLLVNPISGMGGAVGLKGTDGIHRLRRSIELGAEPQAPRRAEMALGRLRDRRASLQLLAGPGEMGIGAARRCSFRAQQVDHAGADSGPDQTRQVARRMVDSGVDLILFAGGDGTARDLLDAVGTRVPVVGIPTGVKMHSGCFAQHPSAAGDAAADFIGDAAGSPTEPAEVVDRPDPDSVNPGEEPVLFGELRIPRTRTRLLGAKARARSSGSAAVRAACCEVVDGMDPRRTYVIGPGTTMGHVRAALGLESDPLAIDVVRGGRPVALDVSEADLLALIDDHEPIGVVVGVIGGQGVLFGRGNQQISSEILRRVDPADITIVAGLEKLATLNPRRLTLDTGDPILDRRLAGYRRVRTAPGESVVYEVAA